MRRLSHALFIIALLASQSPACDFCIKGRKAFRATTPTLMEGLGRHHHPVSTSIPEAQCFFDQGLTYAFAFNHDEAARSFRHAAELDPKLAMAYWGAAYVLGSNYNLPVDSARELEAYRYIQQAVALLQHASPAEQDYVRAMAVRYTDNPRPDYAKLDSAYAEAMNALSAKYPDDLDAAVLSAEAAMNLRPWALWQHDGTPALGTDQIVSRLESVLRRNPAHAGAIHFYIHAVEASPQPERALAPANRLGELVPAAGHLVHMPGHAYIRNGLYEESIKANRAAVILDSTYVAAGGGSGFYSILYYPHNIHFLSVSYALDGQFEHALHYARMLDQVAGPTYALDPHIEGVGPTRMYILTKFRKWPQILAEPAPDTNLRVMTAVWHFARGMAYASTGKVSQAKKELVAMNATAQQFAKGALMGMINPADEVIPIPRLLLEAKIAVAEKRPEEAVRLLATASEIQDGLAYDEPEAWYIASRETLGALLLSLGRTEEAEEVFRADLARYPMNGRSLFGLSKALAAKGQDYDAGMVAGDFSRVWSRADTELTLEDL